MMVVRNKWYVAALAALGLLCTWGVVHLLRSGRRVRPETLAFWNTLAPHVRA